MQYKLGLELMSPLVAGCLFLIGLSAAQAETIYKHVDEQGNVTYTSSKPEGETGEFEEKEVSQPDETPDTDLDALAEDTPIMFYSAPQCAACDMVRTYLTSTGMPFTEVDVSDDYDAQQAMKQDVGSLNVPTVSVGGRNLSGFNASALDTILEVAGYPVGSAGGATDTGAVPQAEQAPGQDEVAGEGEAIDEEDIAEVADEVADDLADDLNEDLQDEVENDNGDQTDADN